MAQTAEEIGRSNLLTEIPRPVATYHTGPYPRIALEKTAFVGKGKTVFITGGATGVGEQISNAFAKAGVERVVAVSRSPGPLEKIKKEFAATYPNTQMLTYSASITDNARMKEIMEEVGQIDILVFSAVATHTWASALEVPDDEFEEVYATNVLAQRRMTKVFMGLPPPKSGQKTLINVSTTAAQFSFPAQSGYGSSKAAFSQILQHFATEENTKHANEKVRIFSFHPGAFYTALAAKHVPESAFQWEDIRLPALFAVWLAGPESDFLHGRWLWAQWDVDEIIALKEKIAANPNFLTIGLVQ